MKLAPLSSFAFSAVLFAFAPEAVSAADLDSDYTVACDIELIGPSAPEATDSKISVPKKMMSGPGISFDLGGYTLQAYGSATSRVKAPVTPVFVPELEMTLFKNGVGPIAGQVNVGEKRTVYARNFLDISYAGQKFTRIDYNCSLTRMN